MKFILPALLLFCAALAAGQTISAPLVAVFRDDTQHLQHAFGIPGSLSVPALHGSEPSAVWNSAFTGRSGMTKTAQQLLVLDRTGAVANSFEAPEGDALFAFWRDGTPALVFFAQTGEVWRVNSDGLLGSAMPTGGLVDEVFAIDPAPGGVRLVARNGEDFFLARMKFASGEIVERKPLPALTAALVIGQQLLLADAEGLFLRGASGELTRVATTVDLSGGIRELQRVGADLARVALQDEAYLLRITADGAEFTRLPVAAVSQ